MSYQITLNDEVLLAWTDLAASPLNISYTIAKKKIIAGQINTLFMEVKDSLEQTVSVELDFVGENYLYCFII